jgi:hypothetical protein
MSRKRRSNSSAEQYICRNADGRDLSRHYTTLPQAETLTVQHADAISRSGEQLGAADRRRVQKVLMFPFCSDAKAPLTGPRVSDADRTRAGKLFQLRRCNGKSNAAPIRTLYPVAA